MYINNLQYVDTNLSNLSDPDVPDEKEPEHWDSTALNTAYYKILTRAGGNGASKSDGGMGVERVMLEGGEVERLETPVPRTGSGGGRNMSPGEMGECGAATAGVDGVVKEGVAGAGGRGERSRRGQVPAGTIAVCMGWCG